VNDTDKQSLFTRRSIILGGIQGLLLTTVLGRLYSLQILSNTHYKTLSDKNRIRTRLTAPLRGQIFDRNGTLLASNHNTYRAVFIRDNAEDWQASLQAAGQLLQLTKEALDKITQDVKRKLRFMPVNIKENLTWDQVALLELHSLDVPGLSVEAGRNRVYNYPHETCHIIGYVAAPADQDLDGNNPAINVPGYKLGKSGLEKSCEEKLRGSPGIEEVEVNAIGKVVREISTTNSIPGQDIKLYLDLALQQTVMARLEEHESACAIILDIKTGGILAYVSHPSYDNNLFVNGINKTDWQQLLNHPYHALVNKGIAGQYSPGSTFKMAVALAGLEAKVIDQHTSVFCSGSVMLGSHTFHCHRKHGHGNVDLNMAIASSCDVYFYHLASMLGIDPMAVMAKKLGLGLPTGVELPGEKSGLIPSYSWKSKVMGKKWSLGETYNASIGQGYVLATPIQLAVMIARLASGKEVTPRFVISEEEVVFSDLDIQKKHLDLVREGMIRVVNQPGGTAFKYRIDQPGFEMAGKTGTTQVKRITAYERLRGLTSSASRPWHLRDHAFFVAYAPISNPRFATAVIVEHAISGGKVAAPIARDILLSTQQIIRDA
jgi:penicillin-binding protein 2